MRTHTKIPADALCPRREARLISQRRYKVSPVDFQWLADMGGPAANLRKSPIAPVDRARRLHREAGDDWIAAIGRNPGWALVSPIAALILFGVVLIVGA